MIGSDFEITAAQAEVLHALNYNRSLQRAPFAGQAFTVAFDEPEPGRDRQRFPEALILEMIDAGLLVATQATTAWPGRNIPSRPFTVRLSKQGEDQRRGLSRRTTTAARAA